MLFSFQGSGLYPAGGAYSSSPDLLADGEGARCAAPPRKPHPRIGPSGHVTGVPSNYEILATPLAIYYT